LKNQEVRVIDIPGYYVFLGCWFMSRVVHARYEKGVLKLLDGVDLEEGEEVVISIRRYPLCPP